jgi:hypothetical protein
VDWVSFKGTVSRYFQPILFLLLNNLLDTVLFKGNLITRLFHPYCSPPSNNTIIGPCPQIKKSFQIMASNSPAKPGGQRCLPNDPMTQWSNDPMTQWSNDPMIQWPNDQRCHQKRLQPYVVEISTCCSSGIWANPFFLLQCDLKRLWKRQKDLRSNYNFFLSICSRF